MRVMRVTQGIFALIGSLVEDAHVRSEVRAEPRTVNKMTVGHLLVENQ